jgi:glycosyltransferase involved in cell wall biosynthesis
VKGFYVVGMSLAEVENPNSGVGKKISNQLKVLNETGIETKLMSLHKKCGLLIIKIIDKINPRLFYKRLPVDFFSTNFYYFRYYWTTFAHLGLYSLIKKLNKRSKILIEIPTYPYDKEVKRLFDRFNIILDKMLRNSLKKYVDRIVTVSDDAIIFGIPTIKIMNGIDCFDIPVQIPSIVNNFINIIVVAQFARWHGYDRLIEGLGNYYTKIQTRKVYIHFVGDGPELIYYKKLVRQYDLSTYIFFYGPLYGKELTDVFNKANIAVCSLGIHRIGIHLGSFLKSREYLARGLPMVVSTRIDVIPPDFEYCLYVPEDDSSIKIEQIIDSYARLLANQTRFEIISKIRKFAEENCDISKTMQPVIEYLTG